MIIFIYSDLIEPELESIECPVTFTIAVIEDRLYFNPIIRTQGSGINLDGTWESYYSKDCPEDSSTNHLTYSITANQFTFENSDSRSNPQTYTSKGQIVQEGNQIYITQTEIDGEPVPEEDQIKNLLGWRVDNQVIFPITLGTYGGVDEDSSGQSFE